MSPGERKQLELKRPGFDFSNLKYEGGIEPSLVLDFANFLPKDNGDWVQLPSDEILSKLNIRIEMYQEFFLVICLLGLFIIKRILKF